LSVFSFLVIRRSFLVDEGDENSTSFLAVKIGDFELPNEPSTLIAFAFLLSVYELLASIFRLDYLAMVHWQVF
jgi:hypothetical protein